MEPEPTHPQCPWHRLQSSVPAVAAGQTHRHHLRLTCSSPGQRSIPGTQGMAQGWQAQPHHAAGFRGVMSPSSRPGCSSASTTSAPAVPKAAQRGSWDHPNPSTTSTAAPWPHEVAGSFVQVMIRAEGDQESVENLTPGGCLGMQVGCKSPAPSRHCWQVSHALLHTTK